MSEIFLTTVIDLVNANIIAPPMDGNHGEAHPKSEDYVSDGIPFIMASDLVSGHVDFQKCKFIQKNLADTLRKGFAYPDDVLLSHKATIGRTAIIQKNPYPYVMLTPQVTFYRVIDKTKLLPHFLRYYFETKDFQDVFSAWAGGGSTRSYLGITAQLKLPIFIPPLHTQTAISSILGSLDDKIDLNRRTNETLEAMTRALFRDWFVDFGPTRTKMAGETPYLAPELWELFPDRLDDEGKPEGWKVCNFDELVSINPKEPLSRNTIAPYLSMSELPTQGCLTEAPIPRPFSGGSKFRNEDTLFARITPCLENGKTALAQNLENNIVGWGSTEFHVLRGKGNVPFSWVYLMARDNEFRANAIRGMTGTSGRQRVASEVLATYKTVTPSGNQIWKAFDHACNPLFEKIIINGAESRTLAQLRDLLLPKFMSGEISIRDAEKMVEDAA